MPAVVPAHLTSAAHARRLQDLQPAGVVPSRKQDFGSTSECFLPPEGGYAAPPPEIAKFRRSDREVGERFLHPGLADDFKDVDPNIMFGNSQKGGDDDSWRTKRTTEMQDQMVAAREQVYHTVKREPLGRAYSRGFALPTGEKMNDPRGHVYGKPARPLGGKKEADHGGFAAKSTVYPGPAPGEEKGVEAYREQYIVSHHSYDVGQQRARKYVWPDQIATNRNGHSFGVGVGSQKAYNNNSEGIKQQFAGSGGAGPAVASTRVENFRGLRDDIGRCRNTGMGTALPADHVFGHSDRRAGDWDVRTCVEGEYSFSEQQPDEDLGCSVTPGFRRLPELIENPNIHGTGPRNHAFGVPNIRSDLPPKHFRSVADNQNYGDDVTAQYLLYPPNSRALGVEDDDFTAQRTKEDIFSIFATITAAAAAGGAEEGAGGDKQEFGPGALGNTLPAKGRGDAPSRLFASYGGPPDELLNAMMERAWGEALRNRRGAERQEEPPFLGAGETLSVAEFKKTFNEILDEQEQRW